MEWSWRTVLILIGLLAIAAIMVDGFRRMKRARAEALRLDIQPGMDELDDEDYNPELPGTVRVVSASAKAPASEKSPAGDGHFQPGYSSEKADAATPDAVLQAAERREPSFGNHDENDVSAADDLKIGSAISDSDDESPLQEASHKSAFEASPEPSGLSTQPTVHSEPAAQTTPPRADIIPTVKPVDLNEKVPVLLDVEERPDPVRQPTPVAARPPAGQRETTVDQAAAAVTRLHPVAPLGGGVGGDEQNMDDFFADDGS